MFGNVQEMFAKSVVFHITLTNDMNGVECLMEMLIIDDDNDYNIDNDDYDNEENQWWW